MRLYVATVFGWMAVTEATTKQEAVRVFKAMAPGASLLPTDVNASHVRPATDDDISWYQEMGGAL